jgi:tellurite resistance protein TerC
VEALLVPVLGATTTVPFDYWAEFFGLVLVLLAFDLFVVNRKAHVIPFREAVAWTGFWIALAMAFNAFVWWKFGHQAAVQFFTAYLTEEALSVDNLFVFVVLFGYFKVPPQFRHRVLFWGILGALVMRGLFIFAGIELLKAFQPAFLIFGAILLYSSWALMRSGEKQFEPEKSLFYRLGNRILPLAGRYEGGKFLVKEGGRTKGTTLLLVLFIIEGTDVVFALDSVPAVIGISQDPFIVYTSNVFAILGLRALFFVVQGVLESVPGLQAGLALVLAFVAVKMFLHWPFDVEIDSLVSMAAIIGILVGSWAVGALMKRAERKREERVSKE